MKRSLTIRIPAPNVRMARDVDQIIAAQAQATKQRNRGLLFATSISTGLSLAAFWAWLWLTTR